VGRRLSNGVCQAAEVDVISRIYIDNYNCFVNFEYQPGRLQLLMGSNGTGKTAVFDVLDSLRKLVVAGKSSVSAFPPGSSTAWDRRTEQTFELGLKGNGGEYHYRLVIDQSRATRKNRIRSEEQNRIRSEELQFDRRRLYQFDGDEAHLFRDDGTTGSVFPFDSSQSAIATIPERKDNTLLTWFRWRLNRIFVFSPDPLRMVSRSEGEQLHPDRRLHQLASWIRHLQLESPEISRQLNESLRQDGVAGCTGYKFLHQGEGAYLLKFDFGSPDSDSSRNSTYTLRLDQLSTGQRTMIALFTILHAAVGADLTLCIDEPDNYVALREIQPWLIEVTDKVKDTGGQCLLISHHPELIDYLAAECGTRFFRENGGPVRVQPFEWTEDDVIRPAEVVARGWESR
jgi:predicted ATPase